jgi:hypothetical protein
MLRPFAVGWVNINQLLFKNTMLSFHVHYLFWCIILFFLKKSIIIFEKIIIEIKIKLYTIIICDAIVATTTPAVNLKKIKLKR